MEIRNIKQQNMPLLIEENSYDKFIEALQKLNIIIGSRREGRQQDALEYWVLQKYLPLTMSKHGTHYHLEKRESPDFELVVDGNTVGIEITESTCEQFQELLNYIDRNPDVDFEYCHFIYGKSYKQDDLYKLLRPKNSSLIGPGWGGLQPESYAAQWARDAALKKLKRIEKWKYCHPLIVLLYDNTPTICKNNHFERLLRKYISEEPQLVKLQIDLLTSSGENVFQQLNIKVNI